MTEILFIQQHPPQPRALSHPSYRADIDGLRSIAVLSVVAFHAAPEFLRGGFIGVDIFFVISGFLISSIIFSNLENNSFSLRDFYARRIRRIFPALILVLATTFAIGWYSLLPDEFAQFGKHLSAGALFISNFALWNEAGYFDAAAETKPLLHLWSLGIEEQFYIFWPALLIVAWKRAYNLLTIVVVLAIASMALNLHGIKNDPTATFYAPQTRFWELLCGSLLAWTSLHPNAKVTALKHKWACRLHRIYFRTPFSSKNEMTLMNTLSIIGGVLLIFGIYRINAQLSFPGKWAAVPVLGTMLIIMAGPRAWLNRTVLSSRVAVWFGLISFPLYLWHWPLLALARIMEGAVPHWSIRLMAVVASILFAWLTYRLIERPIRQGKHPRFIVVTLCVLMAAIGLLGYATYQQKGFPSRLESRINQVLLNDTQKLESTQLPDGSCEKLLQLKTQSVCLTHTSHPDVMVIGDSHAMALNSAALLGKIPVNSLLLGHHGCLPLIGYATYADTQDKGCNAFVDYVLSTLPRFPAIHTIVLATRGPFYFSGSGYGIEGRSPYSIVALDGSTESQETMFRKGYSLFVSKLMAQGKRVIFIIDPPELGEDPRNCFSTRPLSITEKKFSSCSQDKQKVIERQSQYRKLVKEIQEENPRMEIYDPLGIFCDDAHCHGLRAGRMLYFDDDHISVRASELILEDMQKHRLIP
jgi:peptidoglycan/LPS O-acetylase OafA/YrhL